jgi:hypothetical protein
MEDGNGRNAEKEVESEKNKEEMSEDLGREE